MPRFDPHPELRPAIVTGASAGIGAATAVALARAGHPVILAARRVERLADLAAELEADGATALALPLDLADPASIDAFADRAAAALGPVDVLVNNAGVVEIMTGAGADPDEFAASMYATTSRYPIDAMALASLGTPAATRPRTSSRNPSANISSTRRSMRASSSASGTSSPSTWKPNPGLPFSCHSLIGRPVTSKTSSARMTRRTFAGSIRDAATGSTTARAACRAADPSDSARARS